MPDLALLNECCHHSDLLLKGVAGALVCLKGVDWDRMGVCRCLGLCIHSIHFTKVPHVNPRIFAVSEPPSLRIPSQICTYFLLASFAIFDRILTTSDMGKVASGSFDRQGSALPQFLLFGEDCV